MVIDYLTDLNNEKIRTEMLKILQLGLNIKHRITVYTSKSWRVKTGRRA